MSDTDPYIDVVELCAFLQCLGFKVKSLDTSDANLSQDGAVRSVVVNCQSSGLHVVLESGSMACSCPPAEHQNSGFWQVSGVSGGRQADKKSGSSVLGNLPKRFRDMISRQLTEMVRTVREINNESYSEKLNASTDSRKEGVNRSASMVEMKSTPDKKSLLKVDTPGRYRSLDTLTSTKNLDDQLPEPGPLQKTVQDLSNDDVKPLEIKENVQIMCRRQSTYTISSTPGCVRKRNKTSSPIQTPANSLIENLISAEKAAEDLHSKLSAIVREFMEEDKNDSSMSSLALDVSKISLLKGENSKTTYASSPNLSVLNRRDDVTKSRLKRFESASTSNLARPTFKDGKVSKLVSRLSPNIFKKKDTTSTKIIDGKTTKLNAIKPRIVTPVRIPKRTAETTPTLSSAKKKYSNIKSTIPRPSSVKKE